MEKKINLKESGCNIAIFGKRYTGKTTLAKKISEQFENSLQFNYLSNFNEYKKKCEECEGNQNTCIIIENANIFNSCYDFPVKSCIAEFDFHEIKILPDTFKYIILFKSISDTSLKRIWEYYVNFLTFQEFTEIFKTNTIDPYSYLIIDIQNKKLF